MNRSVSVDIATSAVCRHNPHHRL